MGKRNLLPILIVIVTIISPWFWHLQPANLFYLSFNKDIELARTATHLQRTTIDNRLLNRFFINWPTTFLNERLQIMMENLDIGNYFFSSHPRERIGVFEIQKFLMFQFILLLVGLTSQKLKKFGRFLICYFVLALFLSFVFKWREFDKTLPLIPPFIIVMALGFEKIISWSKKWLSGFLLLATLEIIIVLIFYWKGLLQ